MGNLLPSLGRRALPMLEMPKLGGGSAGARLPLSAVGYFTQDPGAGHLPADGGFVQAPQGFPLAVKPNGFMGALYPDTAELISYPNAGMYGMVYAGGKYIGFFNDPNNYGYIATSTDLKNWTFKVWWNGQAATGAYPKAGVVVGNRVIVVGDGVRYSDDFGETWSAYARPNNWSVTGVTYGNGRLMTVSGATAYWSDDLGATWSFNTIAAGNTFRSVAYGNGVWVAAGVYADNTQGITAWTTNAAVNGWTVVYTSYAHLKVRYNAIGGYFIAPFTNTDQGYAASVDGKAWGSSGSMSTKFGGGNQSFNNIFVLSTGYMIAVIGFGAFSTSGPGGNNWSAAVSGTGVSNEGFEMNPTTILTGQSGSDSNGYGRARPIRLFTGERLFQLPNIADQTTLTGLPAKAYMRIAP